MGKANNIAYFQGAVSYYAGLTAENRVCDVYKKSGCQILHQRWLSELGEIDLIARDDRQVIFVEVKKSSTFSRAKSNLGQKQKQRLYQAAELFLSDLPNGSLTDVRFDLALMNDRGEINIIENAFA